MYYAAVSLFLFLLGACVSVGERVHSTPVPGGQKRVSNVMEGGYRQLSAACCGCWELNRVGEQQALNC